ncbi:disease resistance protein RUN1-like [Rutidosis leptorrhynchoides]|uniref:disease resistance protein RUN1-like n=1 Tax=Rutidosis leptorrhynchoides TaxID=125765 RepID=UPI003A999AA3
MVSRATTGQTTSAQKSKQEVKFIEEIIEDIYHRLGGTVSSSLSLLVGREYSIYFITSWLKDVSDTVDILTITGMSGIGKTSVANHVFELHRHEFDASCFIEKISSACAQFNGMLGLQKQLLGNIRKTSPVQLDRISENTSRIENALSRKRAFLVLDDIDNVDQLNELLGNKEILVSPLPMEHKLKSLSYNASRKLLFHHAFKCEELKDGYEQVSDNVVKYCEGHPLALKVVGSSLHNKDVAYWEECIDKLNQGPFSHINNILKMSFESLDCEDKELIKHVACFFVGMDRDIAETILKACKLKHTRSGISNLNDRCLLNIGEGNKFMMHSLIQEMVKDVVHQESPEKPEKRSRLWRHTESYKVLKKMIVRGHTCFSSYLVVMKVF